ncbi:MAG: riboflavin biosynthesis protein RibF [Oscillospiraceae bacterium]|nr:riboflavin biosynthesis protein RibF [Oscillospiraceae bacterium]
MAEKWRVIALGFFDGVHIGHAALLRAVATIAAECRLMPSAITFDAHPQSLISGATTPLINSPEDRAGLIRRLSGIEDIIFLRFDTETANMPWDSFITHLYEEFGARYLVAGYDFRFGRGGVGNGRLLARKCRELGIGCEIVPEVKHDGITCSSSYIRELLLEGDMARAAAFLGHPHVLTDVVEHGYRLGSKLGAPTINMRFEDNVLVPALGVYATIVRLQDGSAHTGVTNIGVRPTVGGRAQVNVETHIIDFHSSLYGHRVHIDFYTRLRPEIKFESVADLTRQIRLDREAAISYFSSENNL